MDARHHLRRPVADLAPRGVHRGAGPGGDVAAGDPAPGREPRPRGLLAAGVLRSHVGRAGEARDRHRPRGGGPLPGRALRDGGEPGHRVAARRHARAGRRAEGQRGPALRREGHRPGARLRRAALGHQPGPALPHRRRLALEGAQLRGPLLSRVCARGRPEPLHEPGDRAQRAPPHAGPTCWPACTRRSRGIARASTPPTTPAPAITRCSSTSAGSWPRATTRTTS